MYTTCQQWIAWVYHKALVSNTQLHRFMSLPTLTLSALVAGLGATQVLYAALHVHTRCMQKSTQNCPDSHAYLACIVIHAYASQQQHSVRRLPGFHACKQHLSKLLPHDKRWTATYAGKLSWGGWESFQVLTCDGVGGIRASLRALSPPLEHLLLHTVQLVLPTPCAKDSIASVIPPGLYCF